MHAAIANGDMEESKRIIACDNDFDVNAVSEGFDYETALHIACCKNHYELIELLLKHPKIDVNQSSWTGPPLNMMRNNKDERSLRLMMEDERVEINNRIVWLFCYHNNIRGMELLIAICEWYDFDLDERQFSLSYNKDMSPKEVARKKKHWHIQVLLKEYQENPRKIQRKMIKKYKTKGYKDLYITHLFALGELCIQGYFTLSPSEKKSMGSRFFSILYRLPPELRMIICNRCYGSDKTFVSQEFVTEEFLSLVSQK